MQIIERTLIDRIETATQAETARIHRDNRFAAAFETGACIGGGNHQGMRFTDPETSALLRDEGFWA